VPTTPYSPGGGTPAHSVLTSHNTPFRQVVNVVRLLFMRLARHVWRNPEITIFRLMWLVITAACIGLPFLTLERSGHLDPKSLGARVGCILLYMVFGLAQSAMTITLVHQQRKLYLSEIRLGFYTASQVRFNMLPAGGFGGGQSSFATPRAARGWTRPPCRRVKVQSC
jgi:hypothetical protein